MIVEWAKIKAFAQARSLSIQWLDLDDRYWLKAFDGVFALESWINKTAEPAACTDFETNFQTAGNAVIAPVDINHRQVTVPSAFAENTEYKVRAKGYAGTATAGTTTNLDFAVGGEDRYINGLAVILKDQVFGDTVAMQIVDVNNVLGYGAGAMLNQFGESWNVSEGTQMQGVITFPYNARIFAGLFMRIVYTSTGGANVGVRINFLLHKKV